ncbi:MAG: hypothetical protein AB1631_14790, partial [Acidobacteriota bacterium]
HKNLRGAEQPKFIEQVLTKQALHKRINDPFHSSNFTSRKNRTGIYINFALSENGAYAALKTDDKTAIIAVSDDVGDCLAVVRRELDELGILNHRKCRFETIT